MLEYIRSSAQSFGVKVAFGVIILVFVFWGVGNFNDRDYSNVVAVVNGQPIVALEFEKAYLNAEEYLMRNNPGLTREQLAHEHLGRQVLNELIQQTLLAQEAERAGIKASPLEMREAVAAMPAFQNESGQFDPDAYKRVLAARRMSVADYERNLAAELTRDKLYKMLTAGVWVDPQEARHRFDFLRESRAVDYIFLPASDFETRVQVTEEEIKKWYDEHPGDFAIPPMVNVEYISVQPVALGNPEQVAEEDARSWYESNKSKFEHPEQIRASHILVALAPDADEKAVEEAYARLAAAKKEMAAGKSFAEVADAINPPGAAAEGGDLGWLKRGETVPEFESVVFNLEPGKISEPLRTPFGVHLALVAEKQAAGITPFEQVKEQARQAVAQEAGADKLQDALDAVIEDNILMKPLADSAARFNLKAETTGLLDKAALVEKLGVKPEGADALLAAPAGSPLDAALEAGDSYIVARIAESRGAGLKPLNDVQEQIKNIILNNKAEQLAMQEAGALLEKLRAEPFEKAAKEQRGLKTAPPLERVGMLEGFLPNDSLMRGIFDVAPGNWLPQPLPVVEGNGKEGAMLVYVKEILPSRGDEFTGVADILGKAALQQRKDGVFSMFMENLFRNANIQITNQNLIDRAGA